MFTPAIYQQRRTKLAKDTGSGLILLLGNDEVGMNYAANTYPFRQDSTFLYFFAVDQPGLAATIDVESGVHTVFGDEATMADVVWSGPQPTMAHRAAEAGVTQTAPAAALAEQVTAALRKGRTVHFLAPYRGEHTLKLASLLSVLPATVRDKRSLALHRA